jgi:outer membrane protein insertion porin family
MASLLVCAAVLSATAVAQVAPPAGPPSSGTLPLPPTTDPIAVTSLQVVDILIEGNRKHKREAVLSAMTTRIGHPFDQAAFEKDIRKLTSKSWFVHVVPTKEYVAGGVVIKLSVVERPVLEYVKYFGIEQVGLRSIEKETGLKPGDPFDPYAVREAARKIESLYHSKGLNDVKVDIPEGTEPGDHGAVFLVNEGKKLKFGDISFEGNSKEIAPDGRLKKIIQSREPIIKLFKGEVDRQKLNDDIDRLTDYYRSLGFFKATVGRRIRYNADEDRLMVVFHIYEGIRYNVRNISFMGNHVFPSEAFEPTLKLSPGDPYDQTVLNKDIGTIKDLYGSNGYVFADAQPDLRFDLEPGVVDLVYSIEEGQQYRIGDISVTIKGDNPHTKHSTILNRLDMRPGEIADIRKFRDSERRIKASGLFNVDPTKGDLPRISFSPPEGVENIAGKDKKNRVSGRRTGNPDTFRGQSPDDAVLNVAVSATALPEPQKAQAPPQSAGAPIWRNGQPVFVPAAQPAPHRAAIQPPAHYQAQPAIQSSAPPVALPQNYPAYQRQSAPQQMTQPGFLREAPGAQQLIRSQSPDPNSGYGGRAVNPVSPYPQPYGQPTGVKQVQYAEGAQDPLANPGYPSSGGTVPQDFGPPPTSVVPQGDFLGGPPPEALPQTQPTLPIDIIASEAQTGRFMLGAGVNSNAGVVGSIILDEQNFDWRRFPTSWEDFRSGRAFRGAGQKFRIEAAPGTQVQRYLFNFAEPYFLDTPVSFGLSGYYFNRYYRDWMEQRIGGRVTLGYQFTPDFSGNIGLRAEDVFISADASKQAIPDIAAMLNHSQLYSVRTSLAHDTRDSTFLPTEGHYITTTFEYFMGDFFYPQFSMNAQKHWLLKERPDSTGRHTFSYYNQLGFSGSNTPSYERFYAGGFSTLRGFQFRGASPRQSTTPGDPTASPSAFVGGDFQFVNSLEYMFPITADDALKMVAFVDFGTVETSVNDFDWNNFRVAPGMGFRVTIPAISAAPIAIDIAAPLDYAKGDLLQNVSFFVGVGR